ncbi:hypothetical protein GWI33_006406 [Rhynchophorus ferrugineus]|uniref:Uncharacterized protein n=1 Tax=Rhynchophorus ferrugineus TaxID=354439 RepID=A0A834IG60_RHYFE|nr:hypothetical protein GWI33_006406 [Rhynchophorus ferrugineus]
MDMNQFLRALKKVHKKISKIYSSLCERKQRKLVRRNMLRFYGVEISDTEYYYVLDMMEQYLPTSAEEISVDSDEEIGLRQYETTSDWPDYSRFASSEESVPEYRAFYVNQSVKEMHISEECDTTPVSIDTDNIGKGGFIWDPKLGIYRHPSYIIPPCIE